MTPGVASALSPLVRRVVAPNPSAMTGPGTNSYLVGIDEVAVIDPGPDDPDHLKAIVGAAMEERVRWVILTHTHPDHAPGAARIREMTGAEILAFSRKADGFEVDGTLGDGDTVEGTEWGLDVLHTPGHADDHLCFFLEEERVLFTGDHIMTGTTVIVSDMSAYMESLERLRKLRRVTSICPGHGDVIEDVTGTIDEYIQHRKMREQQVLKALKKGPVTIPDIVATIYEGEIPDELLEIAARQVHAHLEKLRADGKVEGSGFDSEWQAA